MMCGFARGTIRSVVVGAGAGLLAAGLVACGGTSPGRAAAAPGAGVAGSPASAATVGGLEAHALAVAKGAGDEHPRTAEAVATTRQGALTAENAGTVNAPAEAARPVVLIAVTGNFVLYSANIPPGAALPRGSVLTMVARRVISE